MAYLKNQYLKSLASGKNTRKEPPVEIWNKEKNNYLLKTEIQ